MVSEQPDGITGLTRVCQIIVLALAVGIVSFAAVAILQGLSREPDETRMLTRIACGLSAAGLLAGLLVPRAVVAMHRRQLAAVAGPPGSGDPQGRELEPRLAALFQTRTILAAALFEGAAFFSLFAFLAESQPIAIGCAAVMLLGVFSQFPTAERVRSWLEDQKRLLAEERQLL